VSDRCHFARNGGAVLEELKYDEAGQILTDSLADYLLPTTSDFPKLRCVLLENYPSPINPLGVQGARRRRYLLWRLYRQCRDQRLQDGLEGIVSKRKGSPYRSGPSPDWLKMKNPVAPAVKREAEEDWGR
jgi:hypothetical protein